MSAGTLPQTPIGEAYGAPPDSLAAIMGLLLRQGGEGKGKEGERGKEEREGKGKAGKEGKRRKGREGREKREGEGVRPAHFSDASAAYASTALPVSPRIKHSAQVQ